jgi:hypothetical protein
MHVPLMHESGLQQLGPWLFEQLFPSAMQVGAEPDPELEPEPDADPELEPELEPELDPAPEDPEPLPDGDPEPEPDFEEPSCPVVASVVGLEPSTVVPPSPERSASKFCAHAAPRITTAEVTPTRKVWAARGRSITVDGILKGIASPPAARRPPRPM